MGEVYPTKKIPLCLWNDPDIASFASSAFHVTTLESREHRQPQSLEYSISTVEYQMFFSPSLPWSWEEDENVMNGGLGWSCEGLDHLERPLLHE